MSEHGLSLTPIFPDANDSDGEIDLSDLPDQADPIKESWVLSRERDAAKASQSSILSRKMGVTPKMAEQSPQVGWDAQFKEIDQALKESPFLWDALRDPELMAQAKNDVPKLSFAERQLREIPAGFMSGWYKQRKAELEVKHLVWGTATKEEAREIDAINKELSKPEYTENVGSLFGGYIRSAFDALGMNAASGLDAASEEGLIGLGTGIAVGAGFGLAGGPVAPVTVPAGAASFGLKGFVAGTGLGYLQNTAELSFSDVYNDLIQAKIDPTIAKFGAVIAAVPSAALEVFSLSKAAKVIPGGQRLKDYLGKESLKRILTKPTIQKRLAQIGKDYASVVGWEASTEGLQKVISIITREIAQEIEGTGESGKADVKAQTDSFNVLAKQYTWDKFEEDTRDVVKEAVEGFKAALVLGGAGSGVKVATAVGDDRKNKGQVHADQQRINNLNLSIEELELRKNNPAEFKALIKKLGEGTGTEAIYIDPESAERYFQQTYGTDDGPGNYLMPPEIADNPSVVHILEDIEKAKEEGRDIALPIELYAADMQGTDAHKALELDMHLDGDVPSPRQAFDKGIQSEIEALQAMDAEQFEAEAEVYKDYFGQLISMGADPSVAESQALLHEAFWRSMAARPGVAAQGLSALDLYRQANPTVGTTVDPRLVRRASAIDNMDLDLDRLRAGDIPTDAEIYGESVIQHILSRGGILDEGGELANLDANEGRVGRNRIARKDGVSLDGMAEYLLEEGYITERSEAQVLEVIRKELAGDPVYRIGAANEDAQNVRYGLDELDKGLIDQGLDLSSMTNDEIRAALAGGIPEGALSQYQEALTPAPAAKEQDFGDIKINQTMKVGKSGQPVTVKQSAQIVFDTAMKRRSVIDQISKCLRGNA